MQTAKAAAMLALTSMDEDIDMLNGDRPKRQRAATDGKGTNGAVPK